MENALNIQHLCICSLVLQNAWFHMTMISYDANDPLRNNTNDLVPGIVFICQEVLDHNMVCVYSIALTYTNLARVSVVFPKKA